jgi:hypothetical protein
MDARQRVSDPALLLVGLSLELTAGHVLEQRQSVLVRDEPPISRRHWWSGDEPGGGERGSHLASRDQVGYRSRGDALGDVGRPLMLDQPRLGVDPTTEGPDVSAAHAPEFVQQFSDVHHQ